MALLKSLLLVVFSFALFFTYSITINLFIMGVGFILYYRGAKSVGHWLVSCGFAGLPYKPKWLETHCPKKGCFNCRRWTCPKYSLKEDKK